MSLPDTSSTPLCSQDCFEGTIKTWGRLISLNQSNEPNVIELLEERYSFGRANADIKLNSKLISKQHCSIYRLSIEQEKMVFLEDTSTNGTFVNGRKVIKKHLLKSGDTISFPQSKTSQEALRFLFICVNSPSQNQAGIFQQYHLGKTIGTGNFSSVRKAYNIISGEEVAVKVIEKKRYTSSEKGIDQAMREISIMQSVSHENIIKVIDFFEDDSFIHIVLEYAQGGDLFDNLSRRTYTESDVKRIFVQILEGIKYMHSKGIAHRDLKPENILLKSRTPDSPVVISDFGLASTDTAQMITMCGTPHFVAPEIIQENSKGYDCQVDMWSAGVMLYVLLSGNTPFEASNLADLFNLIRRTEYDFSPVTTWQQISDEAKDLIEKLLVVDPQQRLTAEQTLNHPWIKQPLSQLKLKSQLRLSEKFLRVSRTILSSEDEGQGMLGNKRSRETSVEEPINYKSFKMAD